MASASRSTAIRFRERKFHLLFYPGLQMIWRQDRRQRGRIGAQSLAPHPAAVSAPGSRVVDPRLVVSVRTMPRDGTMCSASNIRACDLLIAGRCHQSYRGTRPGRGVNRASVKAIVRWSPSGINSWLLLGSKRIRCLHSGRLWGSRVFRVSRSAQCRSARPQSRIGLGGWATAVVPASGSWMQPREVPSLSVLEAEVTLEFIARAAGLFTSEVDVLSAVRSAGTRRL